MKSARRAKIAAALVSGKPLAKAAEELGLSRQWTSKEAHTPETSLLLAEMLAPESAAIRKLVQRSVAVVEEALEATKSVATKDGTVVDLGPDHYARLQAVKRLLEIVTAARAPGPAEGASEGGLVTMDRLHAVFKGRADA